MNEVDEKAIKKALDTLVQFFKWRTDETGRIKMPDPCDTSFAIIVAIKVLEKQIIENLE